MKYCPVIQKQFKMPVVLHCTAFTVGAGETMLAEMLKEFEPALPASIKLAYLPSYGMVRLRLTTIAANYEAGEKEIEPYFEKLQELVKEYLVTNKDEGLEKVVGDILKQKAKTMCTAESCTGGYIAHRITSVPGSSAYFIGSIISYANSVKKIYYMYHLTLCQQKEP
jgi:nicotinamide-nucleotide amidase